MKPGKPQALEQLRNQLDGVDSDIIKLLAQRFQLVDGIRESKDQEKRVLQHPEREREVLAQAENLASELGLSATFVRKLFSEIIGHSLARQTASLLGAPEGEKAIRVAFQGVPYSYSYLAAHKYIADQDLVGQFEGYRSFQEAAETLSSGAAELAFLPIENTTAGSINQVYDVLVESELHIVGEETWKVAHCLAGPKGASLDQIHTVHSHFQGLEQCSAFLRRFPHWKLVPSFDTSEALRLAAESQDPGCAAIGSPEAAQAYGLSVLQEEIADQAENHTRFVALSAKPAQFDPRIPCKTSLILTTRHEQGALARCLQVLADHNISLTKLESRPRQGRPWEYMFFIDFRGNLAEEKIRQALDELRVAALYLKVLGSYPAKARASEAQAPSLPLAKEVTSGEEAKPASTKTPAQPSSKYYKLVDRAYRSEDTVIQVGNLLIGGDDGFIVMAGPCSVESKEQINATARGVRQHGAHILRGGVFKPRTSPYSFQGLGYDGLEIMAEAGQSTGMPIVTEVMAVEQVALVAKKADILQIGARNMQNFSLLQEVGRVDRPVLLKRGPSSTIEEWLAAAEYIMAQGNGQVILCERGIRTFEKATRNTLDLSAVAVVRELTHLPIVVDPSHGTGKRSYIAPMAYAARACGAHGIMVEVHPDPDRAMSDGAQSLNLQQFGDLMTGLKRVHSGV